VLTNANALLKFLKRL